MAVKPMGWFRFYSETADDLKIISIAHDLDMHPMMVLGAWAAILCKANSSPVRGSLYVTEMKRYSNVSLSSYLRFSNDECNKLIDALMQYEMTEFDEKGGIHIKNWEKRQFIRSDSSTLRVKEYRSRLKAEKSESMKRFSNAIVTSPENREQRTEEDTSSSPLSSMSAKIANRLKLNEYTGGAKRWNDAIQQIVGIDPQDTDIDTALRWMDENGRAITGPWSIINPLLIAKGQRERNPNGRGSGRKSQRIGVTV